MKKEKIEKLLLKYQVLKEGHFLLSSGLHSQYYFEKFRIIENPVLLTKFCSLIKKNFKDKKIDIVCGPTTGGAIIAYELARQFKKKLVIAEKENEKRVIKRGFVIKKTDRVLIVDDVLTTGASIRETINALKPFGCKIAGIAVLIDRSVKKIEDFEYYSIYKKEIPVFEKGNCPLCKKYIPLEKLGGS
ncbi:MAG: orotate phosphoribosyltransferase [candidate division WOR-3 bacterium]|nr:orotate phosphoribosyltransferase [candidate division WOR-3 bacterium]MDW8113439.1 orotate phosphoribosyltransferase [candidate division WOR-3 bacterium]